MLPQTTAERTLTIAEHTAPVSTWKRAIARARAEHVKVFRFSGEWYATSTTQQGELYHVNGRCTCQGAQHGRICKHLSAVLSARLAQGELAQCSTCGRVLPVEHLVGEWRHVGGQDDRRELYCDKDFGHQAASA
jgi:SWIM zinc finger